MEALKVADIAVARSFALDWHAGQMWGDVPYIVHLDAVANLLASIGAPSWQIIAAYLHDILEDTGCTPELLMSTFGAQVTAWVVAVTGFGSNRKERQQNIVAKLAADTTGAALLKLVDRLINVRKCVETGNLALLKMYRKEKLVYAELFAKANKALSDELNELLAEPA